MEFKTPIQRIVSFGTPSITISKTTKYANFYFNKAFTEKYRLSETSKIAISLREGDIFIIINPTINIPTYTISKMGKAYYISNKELVSSILGEENIKLSFNIIQVENYLNNNLYKLIKI
ncbi:MAG: hypothetical protein GY775_16765 [Candidatus Scalindua sp.]|nr:hypothetical protein [Candidatus Scalindua sp.]